MSWCGYQLLLTCESSSDSFIFSCITGAAASSPSSAIAAATAALALALVLPLLPT
jgi:hypothetical protein